MNGLNGKTITTNETIYTLIKSNKPKYFYKILFDLKSWKSTENYSKKSLFS